MKFSGNREHLEKLIAALLMTAGSGVDVAEDSINCPVAVPRRAEENRGKVGKCAPEEDGVGFL